MKMIVSAAVVLALGAQSLSAATEFEWGEYRMVTSKSAIPPVVMDALVDLCKPCSFADFDEPWNATDVFRDNLPRRHLARAGYSDAGWLIEYDHGGRGRHSHTVLFAVHPSARFVSSSCEPKKVPRCEW
jgi:hypothetical protein